ncbi:hypothetical protein L210DRAFT_595780, partial [Boletus edulis BED1]
QSRFICLVIHEAYNWDRSPVSVAQKLTYGATLKLKALPRDLYPCCGSTPLALRFAMLFCLDGVEMLDTSHSSLLAHEHHVDERSRKNRASFL